MSKEKQISELKDKIAQFQRVIDNPKTPAGVRDAAKIKKKKLEDELEDLKKDDTSKTEESSDSNESGKKQPKTKKTYTKEKKKSSMKKKVPAKKISAPISDKKTKLNFDECEEVFKTKEQKRKKKVKASVEKSENRHLNTKMEGNFETAFKHLVSDKTLKGKAEKNPDKTAQQIEDMEDAFYTFIQKLNALTGSGRTISKARAKEILSVFDKLGIF